jgi:eukaryotic-like serine/threonine-protein kinase
VGGAPAVATGLLVAERYRIESPLSGETETERVGKLWRAYDEVLARPVAILLVRGDDPGVPEVLAGARAAAGLTHAAVVRVYDAGEAPGLAFVVTEFLSGGSLESQLLIAPLDPTVAVDLLSDLAIGVAAAHNVGLHGLSLTPRSVLFTATGAPRLVGIGLAGYTAPSTAPLAPLGVDGSDPAPGPGAQHPYVADAGEYVGDAGELERGRIDAVGLANLLYAALTARWPGLPVDSALPPAPYTEGHLRTPRQVRGGVPREVDEVVAQALGDETLLRGLPEIVSPAEFAAALAPLRTSTDDAHPYGADSGPIIDLDTRQARLINTRLVPVHVWQRWAVGIGVLLLAVVVAGLLVGGRHGYLSFVRGAEPAAPTPTATASPKATPSVAAGAVAQAGAIAPGLVTEFDPYGKHDDPHVSEAPRAVDGSDTTMWRTQVYRTADLGKLKPGVGLLMDLGTARKVSAVHLVLVGNGTSVELFESDSEPANEKAMTLAAAQTAAPSDVTLRLATPTAARYWVVWLTKLPASGTGFQGGIAEMTFLS